MTAPQPQRFQGRLPDGTALRLTVTPTPDGKVRDVQTRRWWSLLWRKPVRVIGVKIR